MLLRFGAFGGVLAAAVVVATTCAYAAAVQPATHRFVKGEHFRYSNVLALGRGEGEVVIDGSTTMTAVDDFEVVAVTSSTTTLVAHADFDRASGFSPETSYFRASADGIWRYADGRGGDNVVTWDSTQYGPQPRALAVGQRWPVEVARTATLERGHAVVRVVSVDPENFVLHVDGTRAPSQRGSLRVTHTWTTDVTFAHGIVHDYHRVDTEHMERGPGQRPFENRTDRRIRLLAQTASTAPSR